MVNVKRALNALPSWPALIIAPILAIVVLSAFYGESYRQCTGLAERRDQLRTAIGQTAQIGVRPFRLADIINDFVWDEVRIVQGYAVDGEPLDCPFGWDWSLQERQAFIDNGTLTVIGFFQDGALVDFMEYRNDWARFEDLPESLPVEQAVFQVTPPATPSDAYLLQLVNPGG